MNENEECTLVAGSEGSVLHLSKPLIGAVTIILGMIFSALGFTTLDAYNGGRADEAHEAQLVELSKSSAKAFELIELHASLLAKPRFAKDDFIERITPLNNRITRNETRIEEMLAQNIKGDKEINAALSRILSQLGRLEGRLDVK